MNAASALAVLALLGAACRTTPPPATAPAPKASKAAPASRCVDLSAMKTAETLLCPCGEEAAIAARCEQGSAKDCSALGACAALRVCGHASQPERYLRYSKRGCELGDATACTNLGDAYRKGWGGSVEPALAQAAFARALAAQRPACEAGDSSGCYMVAHAYHDGLGVAVDAGEARRFFEKSCALGHLFSCASIAADDAEAGHHERAVETMATVCER